MKSIIVIRGEKRKEEEEEKMGAEAIRSSVERKKKEGTCIVD